MLSILINSPGYSKLAGTSWQVGAAVMVLGGCIWMIPCQWPFDVLLSSCQIEQEIRPNQVVKQLWRYIGWLKWYSMFLHFYGTHCIYDRGQKPKGFIWAKCHPLPDTTIRPPGLHLALYQLCCTWNVIRTYVGHVQVIHYMLLRCQWFCNSWNLCTGQIFTCGQ